MGHFSLIYKQNMDHEIANIDAEHNRYPYCIVWTPIPVLTWIFPFLGHMGICTSAGVIRDFAGPYFVSEDNMAFGKPVRYLRFSPHNITDGQEGWDSAVRESSEIYKKRMHNLFCDNCHSHVSTALNLMEYNGSRKWNMVKLAFMINFSLSSKYISFAGFLKQWVPFFMICCIIIMMLSLYHS